MINNKRSIIAYSNYNVAESRLLTPAVHSFPYIFPVSHCRMPGHSLFQFLLGLGICLGIAAWTAPASDTHLTQFHWPWLFPPSYIQWRWLLHLGACKGGVRNSGLQIGHNFIRTPSQSKNKKGKIPNFLRINDLCLFLCLHTFACIKLHKSAQQISLK